MNMKDFKKIHDDEHKAIFRNSGGHEIKIAKKPLSKKLLDELGRVPLHKAGGGRLMAQNDVDALQDWSDKQPDEMPNIQPEQPQASPAGGPGGIPNASAENQAPPSSVGGPGGIPLATQQSAQPAQQATTPQQAPDQVEASAHEQELNREAALYPQDLVNGHITPKTYRSLYENKSTLGKIGTLFGLLISGAGSGLAHQPNAALEMMNKEIDRDLDAQKKSKDNALTYFKYNQDNELNKANVKMKGAETAGIMADTQIKADAHAKNQMLIGALHEMQGDVNKLPQGSPVRARAQQTLDGIKQAGSAEIQQNNKKAAQAIVQNPDGTFQRKQKNLRMMGMLGMEGAETMARSNEDKHVDGFGDASVPVPGDVRQELIAKREYDKAARKYLEYAKKHQANWANMNPAERARVAKRGAVLGAELQGKYRMKTHGGVYKEGEQKFIESIIPNNAVSWSSSFNQLPKVEQTLDNNQQDTENLAKGYGLNAPRFYKGKYYTRGPNGESVEVE